ncbi:hypothetical protein ACFL2X_07870, partial [Candidatus Latescibacterota bacterium]
LLVASVVLLSGLACAAESLFQSLKRYKMLAAFLFVMIFQALTLWSSVYTLASGDLANFLNGSRIGSIIGMELIRQNAEIVTLYVSCVGVLFLGAAMVIFDKFAEV